MLSAIPYKQRTIIIIMHIAASKTVQVYAKTYMKYITLYNSSDYRANGRMD